MDVTFVIVNWNNADLLRNCLASIYETVSNYTFSVVVVDNASSDNSISIVKSFFPSVKIISNNSNLGFARAVNKGIACANGRYVVLLNTDAILTKNAIDRLISFMDKNTDTAVCGGRLIYPDGRKQHSFDNFPSLITELTNKSLLRKMFPQKYPGKYRDYSEPLEVDSIIGACFVIRKECMDRVGMLDEDFYFFLEETDLCFRMKLAGYRIVHVPSAEIVHLQGKSAAKVPVASRVEYYYSRYLFFKKNRSALSYFILMLVIFIRCMVKVMVYFLFAVATGFRNEAVMHKWKLASTLVLSHLLRFPPSMRMEGNA